ncbi:Ribosomal lysine N-methyltransferase set10-like protein [Drosera capensis]
MATEHEAKLDLFLQWLQLNRVQLRCCKIKYSDSSKGFGLFTANGATDDGVLLVVPLDLAITPMRVLQDPLLGSECRAMYDEGDVDDRFLMILFLTLERLRKNSSWKPYLDMIPSAFANSLWFNEGEMLELKGTTLYRATELQMTSLIFVYENKVKGLVNRLLALDGGSESEVTFEDFMWANCVFWSRAMNIPLPHSFVFPETKETGAELQIADQGISATSARSSPGETLWVEGIVPGIDFCNHANEGPLQMEKEISISYGNKGNEELLYLYGFVLKDNPDDYLMVHYPVEALENVIFSDSKLQLIHAQKAELKCLLPRSLLGHGFFPEGTSENKADQKSKVEHVCNYSWSGNRKTPAYVNKLVFPDDFLTSLRTIAMKEDEFFKVTSLLEELVDGNDERQPSDSEVRAAVWEACGDSGALRVLVDLLSKKMMDLEAGTGSEDSDFYLLQRARVSDDPADTARLATATDSDDYELMSRNRWASVVYRHGQKQLTRLFLREAEQALNFALREDN